MKKTFLSLLLIFSLLLTLAPGAFAASNRVEVTSAAAMAEQLAQPAAVPQRSRARSAAPTQTKHAARVLLFADALPDDCGAQRVLHYAAWREFVLEFASELAARGAYETLTETYGITDCWLDTALDGAEVFADTDACTSWGGAVMGLDTLKSQAGRYVPESRRITVAVIDTGADLTIPALQARTISPSSYDFVGGTSAVTDITTGSSAGHGTKVASLLADLTPENVELMILRVFSEETGKAQSTTVLTALQYALEAGADVVNLSLGWTNADVNPERYTFLNTVLDKAYSAGVPVICAGGNNKADVRTVYPANYSTTIAVSAFDQSGTFADSYSNYGPDIDFSAPGTAVQTAAPGGGTATTSGTSLAAPHITAAAAAILLAEPDASASQVYQTLRTYSRDLGITGKDNLYGWGCPVMTDYFHNVLCPALAFSDMPAFTEWSHAGIDYCLEHDLLQGLPGAILDPGGTTTRAQFVTMLWRLAGEPEPHRAAGFTDLTQDWYRAAVAWAVETGVTNGMSETAFNPGGAVTREQMAAFLYRYVHVASAADETVLEQFPDAAEVFAYARPALAWACTEGLIQGVGSDAGVYLQPKGSATRAQVATLLMRFAQK